MPTSLICIGGVRTFLQAKVQVRVAGTRTDVGGRLSTEAAAVVVVCQQVGVIERTTDRLAGH